MIRDVPAHERTERSRAANRRDEKWMGLPSLENGFDGIQIRVYESVRQLSANLFLLQRQKGVWTGACYFLQYHVSPEGRLDTLTRTLIPTKGPVSGWPAFADSLQKHHILSIPDYTALPDYMLDTDEGGVSIEVARKNSYRLSTYPTPAARKDQFPEARNVVELVQLLHREFKI